MTPVTSRVLVVDDHSLIRDGLARLVEAHLPLAQVMMAASSEQALRVAKEAKLDLVILDLGLPDESGLVTLQRLRAHDPGLRVCVMSARDDPTVVHRCVDMGAQSFVSKAGDAGSFRAAFAQVLEGRTTWPHHYANWLASERRTVQARPGYHFTPREREVMEWLAKGYSNKRIAQQLDMLPGTVKVHVSGILRKMRVGSRSEAIALFSLPG